MSFLLRIAALLLALPMAAPGQDEDAARKLLEELKSCRHKIVRETRRDGAWEIFLMDADGSNPVNLTRTPDVDEFYPKVSPDGARIAFVADEKKGETKVRNLHLMNLDGSGRRKIADNARDPCWSPNGKRIAYLGGEFEWVNLEAWATKGIFIHDLETGRTRPHPNKKIERLYTMSWSPDGRWFAATVHGGMGFDHAIIAIEADGEGVFDLKLPGCRPDISPDGTKIAWGHGDFAIGVADMDWSTSPPRASNPRDVVESREPMMTYHVDWSPDGRYIAFSYGEPLKGKNLKGLMAQCPGVEAPGWNTCVCDATKKNCWVALTSDGLSNKEPDWVPVPEPSGR